MLSRTAVRMMLLCGPMLITSLAEAADWPQFLGPNRNGTSNETGLLDRFPEGGPEVVWRVPGGVGMSAVAVADGLAITSWNRQRKQWLVALDVETGDVRWQTPIAESYGNAMGDGPRATPTIHDGVIFVFTGEGVLCAVEQESGRLEWNIDTVAAFGTRPAEYGMSSSPLVVGNHVIVHVGAPAATIGAFDVKTGQPVWKAGQGPAGYSSPTLLDVAGREQVVSVTGDQAIGLDPATGETLWTYPFKTNYACNTANPIVVDGGVFISAGENHGSVLLDIKEESGRYAVSERWSSLHSKSVMRNEWQTSVVVDGYLYGFDNVGAAGPVTHLSCIEATTGKPVWQEARFGKGNLVLADGKLWITTMKGELVLVKVTSEGYQELGRARLFGETRQTMSIANGHGYIRDDREVLCIKLK